MTTFPDRVSFEAAEIPDHVSHWTVAGLDYQRDPRGTAIRSANNVWGMPDGRMASFAHWGIGLVPDRDEAASLQAAFDWASDGGTLLGEDVRVVSTQAIIVDDPVGMTVEFRGMEFDFLISISGDDNGFTLNRPVDCHLIGPARINGNADADIVTDHLVVMVDPALSSCRYLDTVDYHGFGILFYRREKPHQELTHNLIAYCSADGGRRASGGIGMAELDHSQILHPDVRNIEEANPGYGVNLKDRCHDTHVFGGYVENCAGGGMVFSSARAAATGEGCFDCTAEAMILVNCANALTFNKTTRCWADVTAIQEARPDAAAVLVAGFNLDLVWRASIREVAPNAPAVVSRSNDWDGWVSWDGSGRLWHIQGGQKRQTIHVEEAPKDALKNLVGQDQRKNRIVDDRRPRD